MAEEMYALNVSATRELVPLPLGKYIADCRRVYAVKVGPGNQIDRLKAPLVPNGYIKIYGRDYCDTLSPLG